MQVAQCTGVDGHPIHVGGPDARPAAPEGTNIALKWQMASCRVVCADVATMQQGSWAAADQLRKQLFNLRQIHEYSLAIGTALAGATIADTGDRQLVS